jgi:aminoglycoside/choline kinase family phosphotransferase
MAARKLDFLESEKDELLKIAQLNQSADIEAIALAKGLLQNSVWGERWEVSNPKYTTCIVSIQKYQDDTLKIAYELNETLDDWFLNNNGNETSEHHNTVKDLFIKWLNGDENVYVGQEF